jgi:hypothetical protein
MKRCFRASSALPPLAVALALGAPPPDARGAYAAVPPRVLQPGEIAVSEAGACVEPGKTYVLTRNIEAAGSGILLGKDVVLDLNGHTLTYNAAPYEPVPNGSFEEGLKGWDASKAPNARAEDRRWRNPMVGNHCLVLPQGEEVVSPYVTLPVANRPYYAMAAVSSHQMAVGIRVEDESGATVACKLDTPFGERKCCPEPNRAPKLGGGVVFALMFNQPAGRYRIRVKANNRDCILDDIDIRPALDYGIGVVEDVLPWAYYKSVLDGDDTAFFALSPLVDPVSAKSVPIVHGEGSVTIRNGTVRSGARGIRTWGLLSTAKAVRFRVENVKFVSGGINANAMRFAGGVVTNCRTEVDSPWIIDRHRQADYTVNLTGAAGGSLVCDSEFVGGQGQVSIRGADSEVARNLFVNRQTVVNHYSLGAGGGTRVHHNRFLPEQGSAILVSSRDTEIFENEFRIAASPPVNEYANTIYSVSAVRLTDYNRKSGERICVGNRIHHNRIELVGRSFPEANKSYAPSVYGIFMSVGGGQNEVDHNEFTIRNEGAPNHCERGNGAYAFFIGGSDQGGVYHHNTIACDDTPVWIANSYGPAGNTTLHHNRFVCKPAEDGRSYVPVWLGWWKHRPENVAFYSNAFEGVPFGVKINDHAKHEAGYTFGWTLTVKAAAGTAVEVKRAGEAAPAAAGTTDREGLWSALLAEYSEQGKGRGGPRGTTLNLVRTDLSHYTVQAGDKRVEIVMDRDLNIEL